MRFRERVTVGTILGVALACLLGTAARAEDPRAAYQGQAGYALHLLEAGRYGEAEDAAQNLVLSYPEAALPYEIRGTTALYVGRVKQAGADFSRAEEIGKDPSAEYGLALCGLMGSHLDAAESGLVLAGQAGPLSARQAGDLDTAKAYVRLLKGDVDGARAMAAIPIEGDALRDEVGAMAAYRTDPKAGADGLAKFLTTATGVPRLREEDGLRPLFEAERPLEPSVVEPDLQAMYADRLAGDVSNAARPNDVRAYDGTASLTPPGVMPSGTALVSYSVDGQMAAMVNQPPYTFSWNTRHAANGTHTVRIDALDTYGVTLSTQTMTVRVGNKGVEAGGAGQDDAATIALKARLWNLLRLRPCRKVAEWTLAQYGLSAGDRVSADTHLADAAALDPAYKNGRRFARALFSSPSEGAQVASTQPLPLHPISLWAGDPTRKEVALTFDDGPNPLKTPALLDALDATHAPATFFVVGSRAEQTPAILHRMAARGDEVENHSYTHPNMNLVIPSVAEGEVLRTSVLIRALTGHQPHFFRPPGGNANESVQSLARSYGLSLAYWTVDALHAEDVGSSRGLIDYVVGHVHPGSIVLLHNGTDVTTASVPALVSALRARGYVLVTLSHLAQGKTAGKPAAMPKMKE